MNNIQFEITDINSDNIDNSLLLFVEKIDNILIEYKIENLNLLASLNSKLVLTDNIDFEKAAQSQVILFYQYLQEKNTKEHKEIRIQINPEEEYNEYLYNYLHNYFLNDLKNNYFEKITTILREQKTKNNNIINLFKKEKEMHSEEYDNIVNDTLIITKNENTFLNSENDPEYKKAIKKLSGFLDRFDNLIEKQEDLKQDLQFLFLDIKREGYIIKNLKKALKERKEKMKNMKYQEDKELREFYEDIFEKIDNGEDIKNINISSINQNYINSKL